LGTFNPHHAAADGLLYILKAIAATDRAKIFSKDKNGWTPLHEAARAGRTDVIRYLLEEGAEINGRTNNGTGGTPLWWAEQHQKHEAIALLKEHGGVALAPGLMEATTATDTATPKADDENKESPKNTPATENNNVAIA
jgi:ankyrin repeat protein